MEGTIVAAAVMPGLKHIVLFAHHVAMEGHLFDLLVILLLLFGKLVLQLLLLASR